MFANMDVSNSSYIRSDLFMDFLFQGITLLFGKTFSFISKAQ